MNLNRQQMELSFDAPTPPLPPPASRAPMPVRRPRRFSAARWWFARMRDAVQGAREWEPTPGPWGPPEQVHLPLTTPPTRFTPRPPAARIPVTAG